MVVLVADGASTGAVVVPGSVFAEVVANASTGVVVARRCAGVEDASFEAVTDAVVVPVVSCPLVVVPPPPVVVSCTVVVAS
jgi:hypothetical protein